MFKTILVHLRGTSGDEAVLNAALEAARPTAAHLDCLHIRPNLAGLISQVVYEDIDRISEHLDTLRKLTDDAARAAAQIFADFCDKEGVIHAETPPCTDRISAALSEKVGDELDQLITQSRYHDLVVVKGGSEQAGGLSLQDIGRLIVSAGRPVLLAPKARTRKIRTVAIAWKDVPEAARAVTTAMPLISKVEKILVFNVNEENEQAADCESVIAQFRWHGLKAEAHRVVPGERNAADALLEAARAAEADLLVMGAYGRNRLNEMIFGGFTQRILEDVSLPVLLFH